MPKFKIDDLALAASMPNDPLVLRYFKAFTRSGRIDTEKGLFNGQPMSEEQKEISQLLCTTDIGEKILTLEKADYEPILQNVIKRLRSHGIVVGSKYKKILRDMSIVMAQSSLLNKPAIITARPGLGKTEMLISTLIEKSKRTIPYTAMVVTQRVGDAVKIRDEVNKELGAEVCFVRPTFTLMTLDGKHCLKGYTAKQYNVSRCSSAKCNITTCPVKHRHSSFRNYKIVLITTEHFNTLVDRGTLEKFQELPPLKLPGMIDGYYLPRDDLYIDENPGMVFHPLITNKFLNDCMAHLKQNQFDQNFIHEFASVIRTISVQMAGEKDYAYIDAPNMDSQLTEDFIKAWRAKPLEDHYTAPERINAFMECGGIRQNGNKMIEYAIGINRYRKLTPCESRTVILDGTGIKDLTYKSDDFNILDLPEIRSFSRATLHRYPRNLSKNFLANNRTKQKIHEIAMETIRVVGESQALFITYNKYSDTFIKLFEEHTNIRVNHFGNLIGRNEYLDCNAVVFAGVHDWGAMQYFNQMTAVKGGRVDLSTIKNKGTPFFCDEVSEFYSTLLSVGIYQDLMRSNLRIASSKQKVHLYLWTENERILQQLIDWLPKVQVVENEIPVGLQNTRQTNTISTESLNHLEKLKSNMSLADYGLKPKLRAQKLTDCLKRVPTRSEFMYIWEDTDPSHYSRLKSDSQKRLTELNIQQVGIRSKPLT